jgi:hypothetical protein
MLTRLFEEGILMNTQIWKPGMGALATIVLVACGGGSGGGTGTLNLAVTDAPIDGVTEVWVEFDAITLKPMNGTQIEYRFDTPRSINLKALTDGKVELLFGEEVPAGQYVWMKLDVNAEFDSIFDSYVMQDGGGQVELRIPPDRLKLGNEFTVAQGGETAFVIEWNLRMGLTDPVGQPGYKLQPSLRITDMTEHGTIAGIVDPNLLPPIDSSCTSDPNSGDGNVVYVFEGLDILPDDIDGILPDPLTTADVRLNNDGNQEYMLPFLSPGDYTVAFTCQGADDAMPDPENSALPVDNAIEFTAGINTTVLDGQTTIVNFDAI